MQFHAKSVSTSNSGNYYQVLFEEDDELNESDGSYLLIQREFEKDDNGECYIETHDGAYSGHFRLLRFDIKQEGITIEIDRSDNSIIQVTLAVTNEGFAESLQVLKIISGQNAPYDE
jgi:hypothetical protein